MKSKKREPPKPKKPTKRIILRISSRKIEGHDTCTVFEYNGKFFARNKEGKLIKTLDFGKTWIMSEEAEKNAFNILLNQYSKQEKRNH